MKFAGFNLKQKHSVLQSMGYKGKANNKEMDNFIKSTPGNSNAYDMAVKVATDAVGGTIKKMAEGGDVTTATTTADEDVNTTKTPEELAEEARKENELKNKAISDMSYKSVSDPKSMASTVTPAKMTEDADQILDESKGQVGDVTTQATATTSPTATVTDTPPTLTPETISAEGVADKTQGELDKVTAAQGTVSDKATVTAAKGDPTKMTALGTDDIAQIDDPTQIVPPPARKVEEGEMISGSAVDMAAVTEATDIQAATADPSKKATVQGQLEGLMEDFEGGATPAWAAGAMRAANAQMAARGLGSSSMAGQAIIQAAMESAIPIAQQDASTVASFEAQNLSNRQQTALFAAQQRADFLKLDFTQEFQARVTNAAKISDIANMNFTADQQVALENARLAQTVDLTNLNSRNAKIMANAAAMANMDMANLSNQQQARVENAKSFLQMDLTNLNNAQQVEIFKANSVQQAILSDAAADNAAKQFNASSENQTNQFMADLESRTSQFNAAQSNALEQFNVGEVNSIAKFNEEQNNAREEFNTKNGLIIAQANAQWRQATTTTNTAAQNEANMQDAKTMNAFTASTLDQVWQRERDLLSYTWQANESSLKRINDVIIQNILATSSANNTAATNAANVQSAAVAAEGSKWGQIGAAVLGMNW